jgi:hypothetical protein
MLRLHGYSREQHPRILDLSFSSLTAAIQYRQLQERLAPYKITVSRPDTQTFVFPNA